jgi:hypothetical protein
VLRLIDTSPSLIRRWLTTISIVPSTATSDIGDLTLKTFAGELALTSRILCLSE